MILNRPNQLNSFTNSMFDIMFPHFKAWEQSENVDMIILKGRGRAFSSGGDLKFIASSIEDPSKKKVFDHFIDTICDMLHFVGTMQTPTVSFMDGVTMGGGCGLSVLSHFGVATENTKMAMPETRFGHFCDGGSNFFLSRLNGYLGKYIALCAQTIVAEDVLFSGLATHFVPSIQLEYLQDSLLGLENPTVDTINNTIEKFAVRPNHIPSSSALLGENRKIINECFRFDTVGQILKALEKEGSKFSLQAIDRICQGSPIGVTLTLEQLRKSSRLSLRQCIRMEHQAWQISAYQPDFQEGIMSTMFKKRPPQWSRQNFSQVDLEQDILSKYFQSNMRELEFFSQDRDCYSTKQCREYGLPSEKEVHIAKIHNNLKTDNDVVSWFINKRNNKFGVRQEVEEIVSRT
ncbi:ClpP/crotonase-like domain-containing protein [Helicostylum pulchrum]|nr:ClpP/crotonase-like domain-containing protein [Helicostylum pulchrum]